MKILHTSDWHLGRTLYGKKRYEEYEKFLSWLEETIRRAEVDVLLIAGDIFDTSTPSNRAQELYYRFLCRIAASPCRHVVVTAGNHDSPSFLNAPKELLKVLDIHVAANITENREDEVILLKDREGTPGLIVCAVPYLRDRDVRSAEAGESIADKEQKLLEGISTHYHEAGKIAEQIRKEAGSDIPVITMGHLFSKGGKTVEGDGVRELYVGSLAHVSSTVFPPVSDYIALGHLHIPQRVDGSEFIRYSGSPLPIGFGEAKQEKSVCLIEFSGRETEVSLIKVPRFQELVRIKGDLQIILQQIYELADAQQEIWLEVVYDGKEVTGNIREQLENAVEDSNIEVLRVKNNRIIDRVMSQIDDEESLDELNVFEVFEQCMTLNQIPQEQREELTAAYREIVRSLQEEDRLAE